MIPETWGTRLCTDDKATPPAKGGHGTFRFFTLFSSAGLGSDSERDLCRDLNERKARWIERGQLAAGFRCECWNLGCGDRFNLSGRHWEEARSRANRFVVAPGHVVTEFEAVVKEYPHFWLVEKRGRARDEAEALA